MTGRVAGVDDLIAFLRARYDARQRQLDEDERMALASKSEPWNFYPDGHYGAVAEFLSRWDPTDPARVLDEVEQGRRDIEAKLRILDELSWEAAETRAIMYLAQPFSGHPDFRAEWAA